MTLALALRAAIEAGAGNAFNGLAGGLLIAAVVTVLVRVVKRPNPATRFAVWFTALLAVAAFPLFSVLARLLISNQQGGPQHSFAILALPKEWAFAFFLTWVLVSGFACARLLIGLWKLRSLRSSCEALDLAAYPLLLSSLRDSGSGQVAVCISNSVSTPTAVGFFKPTVILPKWSLTELCEEELNVILLHELAHLERRDDWTNLVQKLVQALLFFHPAIWWIGRQLSLEREMACDEAVLSAQANPRLYARCLLALAERSFGHRGVALAQAAVSRLHQLSARVSLVLNSKRATGTKAWKPAVAGVGVLALVGLLGLAHVPQIIAFEDNSSYPAVATIDSTVAPVTGIHVQPISLVRPADTLKESESQAKASLKKVDKPTTRSQRRFARTQPRIPAAAFALEARLSDAENGMSGKVQNSTDPFSRSRELLFVMESAHYDENGILTQWDMQVVTLTVFHPTQKQLRQQTPAKTI